MLSVFTFYHSSLKKKKTWNFLCLQLSSYNEQAVKGCTRCNLADKFQSIFKDLDDKVSVNFMKYFKVSIALLIFNI